MMPSLAELQVFVAIVEAGSLARAAAQLRLSPSMVTTHLARLEQGLGTRLLKRSTRRLDLTDTGRIFLDHARGILDAVGRAQDAVRRGDGRPSGRVCIDAPAGVGGTLVVPLLPACRAQYPDIVIDLALGDRGTLYRADGADILVRVGAPPADAHQDIRPVTLGMARYIMVAAPAYLARHGTPVGLPDLLDHDGILYASRETPDGRRWRFQGEGEALWLRPRPALTFNDGAAMIAACAAGAGIAQTLDILAAAALADGSLVRLLPGLCSLTVPVVMTCPGGRAGDAAVRAVAGFLADHVTSVWPDIASL
ncbi:LysR family transcriptional regulator [Niveispirillum fermenti]|uniref:LysR family transcriptional regulator n=1 Tax=Niveispirillum fermenti TaxID=1233113 RepID=UPI003A836B6B